MLRRRNITGDLIVHQGILENVLHKLFDSRGLRNARKEVSIKYPLSGKCLEVDVWYPDIQLCFEFQDDHHYQATWYCQAPLSFLREKDDIKNELLLQRGETLIVIPCWWDGSESSLIATINFHRPDLFTSHFGSTIPSNPPLNFFSEETQLMLASFPNSPELVDVSPQNQWWLGEKYDGVRCFWNPNEKQMYSRQGIPIELCPSVNSLFRSVVLDGEIWCGRGLFIESNVLAQSSSDRLNWPLFRVVCFDEASRAMTTQPFENRYSLLLINFPSDHPTTIVAPRFLCSNSQLLVHSLIQVVDEGGEGVILRKPNSTYQFGRSNDLVKLKGSRGDQEALVNDIEEDGSLLLQLPDGTNFIVPKKDCILHRRAARGDIVSFKYDFTYRYATHQLPRASRIDALTQELSAQSTARGAPSNAIVYRIRDDLLWEDVVQGPSLPVRRFVNEPHQKIESFKLKKAYWTPDAENMRKRIEEMARAKGFDPLVPENWYLVPSSEFTKHKSVRRFIQKHHNNSWMKGLVCLFPDLSLDLSKFSSAPLGFWHSVQNRREIFEKFAQSHGGDPADPEFWYSVRISELMLTKGYADTIMHLFPELNLVRSNFKPQKVFRTKDPEKKKFLYAPAPKPLDEPPTTQEDVPKVEKYQTAEERKLFFDSFAASQNFDPLIAENWYNVSALSFSQHKDYATVVNFYGGKLQESLVQLYPDIGLQPHKFKKKYRAFFDNFAATQHFDPLVPESWYHSIFTLFQQQEFGYILKYYRDKLSNCLIQLYPDIGLQKNILEKLQLEIRAQER